MMRDAEHGQLRLISACKLISTIKEDPMRIRYSMLLSIMITLLSPHASGGVGVTSIVQLHAPLLLHSDGTAYSPSEVTVLHQFFASSVSHSYGTTDLRVPTGQVAQCAGRDCTEEPFGFARGIALPTGGTIASAELDLREMDTLMNADAHQYTRSDFFAEDEGHGLPFGKSSQAKGGFHMVFQVAESDSMTLTFGIEQYLHAFYESGTPHGSFVKNQTGFGFSLYDSTASTSVLDFAPAALNYTIRLDGKGPLELVQDGGMQFFSVESGLLQAGHVYELIFSQMTLSSGMIAVAVPEPSTLLMCLAGFACLAVPFARRRMSKVRGMLASLMLVTPGAVLASEGTQALAGIDLYGPRLLHSDGTRYQWSDFTARAPISPYANAWTEANGRRDVSGTISFRNSDRQLMAACTGTDCSETAFPGGLTGNTASASVKGWQMPDFVERNAYQHIQVNASAVTRRTSAEIKTFMQMWNFSVNSMDSMTIEFDARAFGRLEGNASAGIGFIATIKNNWFGDPLIFMPEELNVQLQAGDADYDSGLRKFSFTLPSLMPGPGYFLVFEQSLIASAVPEPAPAAMLGVGLAGLLALARRRRVAGAAAVADHCGVEANSPNSARSVKVVSPLLAVMLNR